MIRVTAARLAHKPLSHTLSIPWLADGVRSGTLQWGASVSKLQSSGAGLYIQCRPAEKGSEREPSQGHLRAARDSDALGAGLEAAKSTVGLGLSALVSQLRSDARLTRSGCD